MRLHGLATLARMITGAHLILYSHDADADRAFIRDTLGFLGVDAGGGWLIFKLPPAELAAHPTDGEAKHEFYLMCDSIETTLAELTAKGVEISDPVKDQGWGLIASIRLPSGADLPIYEPRHPVAYDLAP
jgi:catechol 2,3-dioxygenase-like lactoylglutathione lyase family enzyme